MKPKNSAAFKVTPFSPKSNQSSAFGDCGECRCNASGDGSRIRNKVRSNCATKFGGTDGKDRKHKKGGIDNDCRNLKKGGSVVGQQSAVGGDLILAEARCRENVRVNEIN